MRGSRALALPLLVLVIALPERAWAFHYPPWDTGHELFQASQGDPNLTPGPTKPFACGSPVEVATGNFTQSIPVLSISGRGPAINLTLTYHSFEHRKGPFGAGWTSSYDQRVVKTTDGVAITAICATPTGRRDRYARRSDGTYSSPPSLHNTLSENADGSFVLREKDGVLRTFNTAGRMTSIVDRNGNTLTLAYDATGFLTTVTDASGRSVTLTKGANGRVATVTDPAKRPFTFSYDSSGNLTSLTDPLGNSTTLQYDSNGRLTALVDPNGNTLLKATYNTDGTVASYTERGETWTVRYTPASGQTTETDSSFNRWTYFYNSSGSITKTTDPLGNTVTRVFDASLNPTQVTDQNGQTTSTTYDAKANPLTIQDALSNKTSVTYDPTFNFPSTVKDPLGNVTTFTYDSKGNLTKVADPLGNATQYQYDSNGQLVTVIDAAGNSSSLSYDDYGNVVTATDPLKNSTTSTYNILGGVTSVTDANGKKTQFTYDANRRLTKAVDPISGTTLYSYDKSGNLTSITTANGAVTSYAFDNLNRVVEATDPAGKKTTYAYDRKDNLTSKTDRNGTRTSYSYDRLNRLVSKFGSHYVSYSYDKAGQLLTLSNSSTTLSFSYDAAGRLTQAKTSLSFYQPTTTISYTYDANGRRQTMTDPSGGVTTYTYDASSRLASLKDPSGNTYNFTYDATSRRTGIAGPLGRAVTYAWDAASRITSLTDQSPSSTLTFSYTYDPTGSVLSKTDGVGLHSFTYDALSRLTGATHPSGLAAESYTYDFIGNRTASSVSATYSHDSANRLTSDAAYDYTYDANGNLTKKTERSTGKATTYAYDSDNRLTSITPAQGTAFSYKYDGLGRRIAKIVNNVTTAYVYDDADILTEYSGGNLAATYTHGPGVDELLSVKRAGTISYLQRDALGSVARAFSSSGTNNTYQYDSYGRILSQTGTAPSPFAFTGREYDPESGLYYYRARYYDPALGRFISEDPMRAAAANFYSYALNSPTKYVDPLGLLFEVIWSDAKRRGGHKDSAVTLDQFIDYTKGKSLYEIQHQMDDGIRSSLSAGGPDYGYRWVINPRNPSEVLDMRHFLVVGPQGEGVGLLIELAQLIGDNASAFDAQDFLSNAMGSEFFRSRSYDKTKPLGDQLRQFFNPGGTCEVGGGGGGGSGRSWEVLVTKTTFHGGWFW